MKVTRILTALIMLLLPRGVILREEICSDIVDCTQCNEVAVCQTVDYLVPPDLPDFTKNLTLIYSGPPVNITPTDFGRFRQLTHLNITGPIAGFERDSFRENTELETLQIYFGVISVLPDKLFAEDNKLQVLSFIDNSRNLLPVSLFPQLRNLKVLRLRTLRVTERSYLCPDAADGLGKEFKALANLEELILTSYLVTCPENLTENLFIHLTHIKVLKLNDANFFETNKSMQALSHLQNLEYLSLSNIRPFNVCPREGIRLFSHLPSNISSLVLRRWRTADVMSFNCTLKSEHLDILKQRLPNLKLLNFKYSDFIFGHSIYPDLFSGFNRLTTLNIGWCRITIIEKATFDSCRSLTTLILNGNPLGPRQFNLFSRENRTFGKLKRLSMERTSISSDDTLAYKASHILDYSPNLEVLDVSSNFLHRLPSFLFDLLTTRNRTEHSVRQWILDNNWLENLFPSGTTSRMPLLHCPVIPNLTHLSIRNNRLTNILGICPTVTHLYLEKNRLNKYWESVNSQVIKSLHALKVLDLSQNKLKQVPSDLLYNMSNLTEVYLTNNNIMWLPKAFFSRNTKLQLLNLRENNITQIEWDVSQLPWLSYLDLSSNSLTTLTERFVDLVNNSRLAYLALKANKFNCICNENHLEQFFMKTTIVPSNHKITCAEPVDNNLVTIYNYRQNDWHCKIRYPVYYTLAVLGACFFSACLILPGYKYWWYIRHLRVVCRALKSQMLQLKHEYKCSYDAYVSYDHKNTDVGEWIVGVLIPAIEQTQGSSKEGIRLFIEDRDATPGSNKHTERCKALENSRKILVVLSNSYLESKDCLGEADLAGLEMFGNEYHQPNRIIVLVRERLNERVIEAPISSLLLQNVLMAKDGDERRLQKTLQKVRQFLSRPEFVYKKSRKTMRRQLQERVELDFEEHDM